GQPVRPADRAPQDLEGLRVLVVDDNATNRRILNDILINWRMKPVVVNGGEAALAAMRQENQTGERFWLVLLDYHMPEMDGLAVAEQIKQDAELADASIILLTSAIHRGIAARSRELGLAGYLAKPFSQSELLEAISGALLNNRQAHLRADRSEHKRHARSLRILLVEDHEVNQRLAVRLLENQGHVVTVAGNGREALAAYDQAIREKRDFELILMDVQMPEMNGFEATAAIRQKEEATGRHTPIIAMTARAMKGDKEACLEAGMDGYIPKPISSEELFQLISNLVPGLEQCEGSPEAPPVRTRDDERRTPAGEEAAQKSLVIDYQRLMRRVYGDEEFARELAGTFMNSCAGLLSEIRSAIDRADCVSLDDAAHKLKGAAASLQADAAFEAALRLESMGRARDLSDAREAFAVLEQEIEALRQMLFELGLASLSEESLKPVG
ncbi:MAG TPA: response regulator, partial [Blastocatellia bacterium]|nr:response regulator [Blastocatellia bacterium]